MQHLILVYLSSALRCKIVISAIDLPFDLIGYFYWLAAIWLFRVWPFPRLVRFFTDWLLIGFFGLSFFFFFFGCSLFRFLGFITPTFFTFRSVLRGIFTLYFSNAGFALLQALARYVVFIPVAEFSFATGMSQPGWRSIQISIWVQPFDAIFLSKWTWGSGLWSVIAWTLYTDYIRPDGILGPAGVSFQRAVKGFLFNYSSFMFIAPFFGMKVRFRRHFSTLVHLDGDLSWKSASLDEPSSRDKNKIDIWELCRNKFF